MGGRSIKWLKTLFGKQQTTSTGEEQEKLDRAFRVGQEAAQSMVADLDGFIDSRFGHLKEAYLDILATGLGRHCRKTNIRQYL